MKFKISGLLIASLFIGLLSAVAVNASEPEVFSGELRLRSEARDNSDFNDAAADNSNFHGFRLRLAMSKKVSDTMDFYVQLQDTRIWGMDSVLTDTGGESIDLHRGYVDLTEGTYSLRVGRQELSYGSQRLIGAFGWSNNGRAFDGIKLSCSCDKLTTDLFFTKVKETPNIAAGNSDTDFFGLYSTLKRTETRQVEFYILQKSDYSAKDIQLTTLGTRIAEKNQMNFDYTGELAYQTGSKVESDISAYALAVTLGYSLKTEKQVRFGIEYDRASGDDDAGDDKVNTFDNLYPTNHLWYGSMDYQGWKNMESVRITGSIKPRPSHTLVVNYHLFRLLETADAWYGAKGKKRDGFGAGALSSESLGSEIDLLYRVVRSENLKVEVGYSHYIKGSAIKDSVAESIDSDWGYFQLVAGF